MHLFYNPKVRKSFSLYSQWYFRSSKISYWHKFLLNSITHIRHRSLSMISYVSIIISYKFIEVWEDSRDSTLACDPLRDRLFFAQSITTSQIAGKIFFLSYFSNFIALVNHHLVNYQSEYFLNPSVLENMMQYWVLVVTNSVYILPIFEFFFTCKYVILLNYYQKNTHEHKIKTKLFWNKRTSKTESPCHQNIFLQNQSFENVQPWTSVK